MTESVFQFIDQLKSSNLKDLQENLPKYNVQEPKYLLNRLFGGLCSDNPTFKSNCISAILYFSKKHDDLFKYQVFIEVLDKKLPLDNSGQSNDNNQSRDHDSYGKKHTKNIHLARALVYSIIPKIFGNSADFNWEEWKNQLLKLVAKEPLTKFIIFELITKYINEKKIDYDLSESTNNANDPIEAAFALKLNNKPFIKKMFGSKVVDLANDSQQNVAISLIDNIYKSGFYLENHSLLTELGKQKNAFYLVKNLCGSRTKSRKRSGLTLYLSVLEQNSSEQNQNFEKILPEDNILSAIRFSLHQTNDDLKNWILESFCTRLINLFKNFTDDQQHDFIHQFLKFEPMLDSNTRSKFLLKIMAFTKTKSLAKIQDMLIKLSFDSERSKIQSLSPILEKLPETQHDIRRWAISTLETLLIKNPNFTDETFHKIVKKLFEQAYVELKEPYLQQSLRNVLFANNASKINVNFVEVIGENFIKEKLKENEHFDQDLWEMGCRFEIKGMEGLMRILLVNYVELCVNASGLGLRIENMTIFNNYFVHTYLKKCILGRMVQHNIIRILLPYIFFIKKTKNA